MIAEKRIRECECIMTGNMKSPDLVTLFQALGDRTRLRLLALLSAGEICVCFFVEVLGESQPKISRHLSYLRRAGLVAARREGKWIHYRLVRPSDARQAEVLDATLSALEDDREIRRDRTALERACCAVRLPGTLQHAPKPELARSTQ
jgi:ArsR family transcriptional regulator